ncbi:MAG: lipase secretion chaperone [Thermodesulfobacteriota bacterium]
MNLKMLISSALILIVTIFSGLILIASDGSVDIEKISEKKVYKAEHNNETSKEADLQSLEIKHTKKQTESGKKNKNNSITKSKKKILKEEENLLEQFHEIMSRFKSSYNTSVHFEEVLAYLKKNFDEKKAEALFELYTEFVNCSQELSNSIQGFSAVTTKDDILERLDYISEFRKDYLGKDLYDVLYKEEELRKRYSIEKNYVLNSKDLYSYEKESLLKEIDSKYDDIEKDEKKSSYQEYREALNLYKKDISELSQENQQKEKEKLRGKYFSKESLEKRNNLVKDQKKYKSAVENFRTEKQQVFSDKDLSTEEKESEISKIKQQIFTKEQAKRFERTENIKKEREKMLSEYGFDSKE